MAVHMTKKDIFSFGLPVFKVAYGTTQNLLGDIKPIGYNAGKYGWNFDIYFLHGFILCSGYRCGIGADVTEMVKYYNETVKEHKEEQGSILNLFEENVKNTIKE